MELVLSRNIDNICEPLQGKTGLLRKYYAQSGGGVLAWISTYESPLDLKSEGNTFSPDSIGLVSIRI